MADRACGHGRLDLIVRPTPRSTMTEPDPTGYGESPDTGDGPVGEDQTADGPEGGATLTTDDDAQEDDALARPGNSSD
jgi:hypothetical protein